MFIEVQPYDSNHPLIINCDYIVQIESMPYGSNIWIKERDDGLRMLRTSLKYEDWVHALHAR